MACRLDPSLPLAQCTYVGGFAQSFVCDLRRGRGLLCRKASPSAVLTPFFPFSLGPKSRYITQDRTEAEAEAEAGTKAAAEEASQTGLGRERG